MLGACTLILGKGAVQLLQGFHIRYAAHLTQEFPIGNFVALYFRSSEAIITYFSLDNAMQQGNLKQQRL